MITYFTGSFPEHNRGLVADDVFVVTSDIEIGFGDSAGGEDYHVFRPLSYPQTDVFILCFSMNDIESFQDIFKWYPEVTSYCPNTPIILVGTKLDEPSQYNDIPVITTEEGEKMAEDIGAVKYFECSSLLQKGVQEIFDFAISIAVKNKKTNQTSCLTS